MIQAFNCQGQLNKVWKAGEDGLELAEGPVVDVARQLEFGQACKFEGLKVKGRVSETHKGNVFGSRHVRENFQRVSHQGTSGDLGHLGEVLQTLNCCHANGMNVNQQGERGGEVKSLKRKDLLE
jgi:hypothetical protein